ncbi:MAG: single-stranded DNA-binding protein [Porticoccaceae bacterium]|nr:single-stranded DNA-binding protein [Porticoccaceae bacterium]|tara:strand:+ start:4673 stop:5557 length:885 start_codon:yes stop_codon:yes gene_type:complete
MSFETLKRNRGANINKIIQAAESANGGETKSYADDRIWKPTVDKAGNGYAVIRFLPGKDGEIPFVRYWDHGFKGPTGMWYIENSLTSIGQSDPVGELNSKLWNSGIESDKEKARAQKRRLHYVTNIYVVNDPSAPHNEGKVFLYKFGKKIFDKIYDLMNPAFADEKPIDPFDMWEGADFKLKIRNVEGYRNYDKSEFTSSTQLLDGNEDQLKAVYEGMHDLTEFTNPKNYKTYDELKTKLMRVLGEEATAGAYTVKEEIQINEPVPAIEPVSAAEMDDEAQDTMSYFAKLAKED